MIRNSVVAKLWLTIIALVVIVLSLLAIFLEQLFDTYFYASQEEALQNRAAYISDLLIREPNSKLAVVIAEELIKESNSHMYIIGSPFSDKESLNFLDSLPPQIAQKMKDGKPEVRRGTEPGFGNIRSDVTSVWVLQPIKDKDKLRGLLLVHQPITVIEKAINSIRNLLFFAAGLGTILTTGLAFVVSKNLSNPVLQMTKVAERMARGDFQGKVNVVTGDEVGKLGKTLNFLAENLENTINHLSKEKEQLSSILQSMTDGVISADLTGRVMLANPPAKRWLRALMVEETGKPDEDRLPGELNDLKNRLLEKPETRVSELVWQGRYIASIMTPLYEPGEKAVRGVVIVFRDVTEERTLDRMRKDFVASVSHELRTPLAMMQGYGEALVDEFGEDPEQRAELTGIILEETHRMKRLVNDLLDLAQLESGQFELHTTDIDVGSIIKRVARKFQTLAHERGIRLLVDMEEHESCIIKGDSDRLEQVFTNLVDNALRHTPSGEVVSLTVGKDGAYVRASVSDTGEGIPEEDLPFIFERFYKVDKARTRSKGGTGLGLSIAKNIILKHHGDVVATSTLGVGTTFTVILPLQKDE